MSVWDSIVGQQAVVGQLQAIVSGDQIGRAHV